MLLKSEGGFEMAPDVQSECEECGMSSKYGCWCSNNY